MGVLLLVLGLLAAGAGAAKLRGHGRTGLGVPSLAVAEVVLGALLVLGSGVGLARARPVAWAGVVVTAAGIVVSSTVHLRRWRRAWRRRADSEEARLRRYLEMPPR